MITSWYNSAAKRMDGGRPHGDQQMIHITITKCDVIMSSPISICPQALYALSTKVTSDHMLPLFISNLSLLTAQVSTSVKVRRLPTLK